MKQAVEDRFAFHFGEWYGKRDEVRDRYSYKWTSDRVKNVLGLAFAVPKKDDEDDAEDVSEENRMRGGELVNPHLMKQWTESE